MLTILVLATILAAATAAAATPTIQVRVSDTIVATWRCEDKIPRARTHARSPWTHHSPGYWAAELALWQGRLAGCRSVLAARAREWNWQAWLPPVWRAIAQCETQMNWQHNSGTYQGAFGFYYGSWDAFRPAGYPSEAYLASPWKQYQVALAIWRRYGYSGWGCHTHGGYRYWLGRS